MFSLYNEMWGLLMGIFMVVVSYLIGSLSMAKILARKKNINLSTVGTKNPGAYNVYNQIGPRWGISSAAFDILKGFIPVVFSKFVLNFDFSYLLLITLAAVIGHIWPLYYKFDGGRGLATTMGVLIVWDFYLALFIFIIAGLIAYWARYFSELKPRISLVLLPLFSITAYYIRFDKELVLLGIYLALIIYLKAIQFRYKST